MGSFLRPRLDLILFQIFLSHARQATIIVLRLQPADILIIFLRLKSTEIDQHKGVPPLLFHRTR